MTVNSKLRNTISKEEYLKIYHSLNSPLQLTHYRESGCLMMRRDKQLIKYISELEAFRKEDEAYPDTKHWYELEFIPFDQFKLIKTKHGIMHCANDEI
jgi:hypothetical protein